MILTPSVPLVAPAGFFKAPIGVFNMEDKGKFQLFVGQICKNHYSILGVLRITPCGREISK
ncbi:hypothetical protein KL86DPRO_70039 [uncultured delta proteobacterium]|uniref:Uncharacterized protein n=1 Tax=uncultured delta proteobacterium TaxID=34034 RepID=A0A212KGR0_9DELT|nr:hypothetical protein KL86DPRO_70039 [uncultured delta proteobacterium]